jgi:alpha-tubulin suppressor-like RCC1 family protein
VVSHTLHLSQVRFIINNLWIEQGYVFSFGSNTDGQLGVNDHAIKYSTAPLLVSDLISM